MVSKEYLENEYLIKKRTCNDIAKDVNNQNAPNERVGDLKFSLEP